SASSPRKLFPSKARTRATMSAGPSSLASRCVTRQAARTATTKRNHPRSGKVITDLDWPVGGRPVGVAGRNRAVLDIQVEDIDATVSACNCEVVRHTDTGHS